MEPRDGLFVAEGVLALEALLASPFALESLLVLRERLGAVSHLDLPDDIAVYVADEAVLAGITGYNVHRGVLGLGRRSPALRAASLVKTSTLVLVVEGVNDQENLGAIFRNGAAFGVDAALLDPTCADPLYRRSVRVSLGHTLKVPFARMEPWPSSLDLLGQAGFCLVALTPEPAAQTIDRACEELAGRRVALLVGAERHGLSDGALERARKVRIPMAPGVDSLNVAAATAVALHRFAAVG